MNHHDILSPPDPTESISSRSRERRHILALGHSSNMAGAQSALVSLMRNTADQAIDWTVVVPQDGPFVEAASPYGEIIKTPFPRWCRWRELAPTQMPVETITRLHRILGEIACDIALTNTMTTPWLADHAHTRGLPHIWYVHEYGEAALAYPYGYSDTVSYIDAASDVVLSVSDTVQQNLVANGMATERIMPIHQSFDIGQFQDMELPAADNDKLLIVGAIKQSKGQLQALQAFDRSALRDTHELTIAGPVTEEVYADAIRQYITDHGLEKNVRFLPHKVDTAAELARAGTVLVCSENESLGRVTIEALASGRTVIGNNSGGTSDLLAQGRGILYDGSIDDLTSRLSNLDTSSATQLIAAQERRAYATDTFSAERERQDFLKAIEQAARHHEQQTDKTDNSLPTDRVLAALQQAGIIA